MKSVIIVIIIIIINNRIVLSILEILTILKVENNKGKGLVNQTNRKEIISNKSRFRLVKRLI